jgi:hypothetical protein
MDILEKVLTEQSGELIRLLTFETGMSRGQAEVFLREAKEALLDSYHWQVDELGSDGLSSPSAVRDLLAGMSGRALAAKVGMSAERTWDGLRALVPAVVYCGAAARWASSADLPSDPPRRVRRLEAEGTGRFDIGFGLSFEFPRTEGTSDRARRSSDTAGFTHPIFGRLLAGPGTPS